MILSGAKAFWVKRSKKICNKIVLYGLFCSTSLFPLLLPALSNAMISSNSAVVVEASTGRVLYAKNPHRQLPPASTVKLMTAIVSLDKLDPSSILTVSKNAVRVPRTRVFERGDRVSVEQLLYAALIKSANDAAVALAEGVSGSEKEFVDLVNQKAASIGAENSRFINSTGLPGPGQYTTVLDLTRIMRYALDYPRIREIIGTPTAQLSTARRKNVVLKNTDKLLWSERDLIGGKTGYTLEAGHCFVCAAGNQNRTIIVALLGSPSRRLLWKEAEELIRKGFNSAVEGGPEVYFLSID